MTFRSALRESNFLGRHTPRPIWVTTSICPYSHQHLSPPSFIVLPRPWVWNDAFNSSLYLCQNIVVTSFHCVNTKWNTLDICVSKRKDCCQLVVFLLSLPVVWRRAESEGCRAAVGVNRTLVHFVAILVFYMATNKMNYGPDQCILSTNCLEGLDGLEQVFYYTNYVQLFKLQLSREGSFNASTQIAAPMRSLDGFHLWIYPFRWTQSTLFNDVSSVSGITWST